MGFVSILGKAHRLVAERLASGEPAVDATVGGGADTLFLAKQTGPGGIVFGFDIQLEAIERAKARLEAETGPVARVEWLHRSHAEMRAAVPAEQHGKIAAVMFNLGYLPGGDHRIVTRPETTLAALEAALHLLRPGGIITAVLYSGHAGGKEEADAVLAWAAALPQNECQVLHYRFLNQRNHPPELVAVEKRG